MLVTEPENGLEVGGIDLGETGHPQLGHCTHGPGRWQMDRAGGKWTGPVANGPGRWQMDGSGYGLVRPSPDADKSLSSSAKFWVLTGHSTRSK
jgi:hypothetical protein